MSQHVRIQHLQQVIRHHKLSEITLFAHLAHPAGTVAARGVEKVEDVVRADVKFGKGASQEVSNEVIVPLRYLEADESDAGE